MSHREYFYVEPGFISPPLVEIKGSEFKHLARVLRKNVRDVVEIVDGVGNLYTAVLTRMETNFAQAEIQKRVRFAGEPNIKLTLAQAIPRNARFELVIEKGTELGVSSFIPTLCEFSLIKESETKGTRWQNIAIAAMKQCGRSVLPAIQKPQPIQDVITQKSVLTLGLFAHPAHGAPGLSALIAELKGKSHHLKSALIAIGPEGGFSQDEVKLARSNGFYNFTLGPRRLRSETAGIAAAALFMELMGELS
ncbi:MAG: RsmE family RNA methyltransferase [Candidatus Zhuqueibacterota bacterium]